MLENFCNLEIYGDLNVHEVTYKIILYAYMNNIYSCRKMERAVQRDIHMYLVCRTGAARLRDNQPFPQSREERYKQHLHTSGACVD